MKDPNENRKGYKKTKVGWIPNDWSECTLESLVKRNKPIVYGIVQAGPDIPGGTPYIRSTDVGDPLVSPVGLMRTSIEIAHKYRRSVVAGGDLVFSLRGNIGEVSEVPDELEGANLTQGTARLSLNGGGVAPFVRFALGAYFVRKNVDAWAKGSTFREITIEDLRRLTVPMPSEGECEEIAKILSSCEDLIRKSKDLIGAKQRQKKVLMQQLLSGKKRLPGFAGQWRRCHLGDLFDERNQSKSNKLPLLAITGSRGIIPASEIDRKDSSSADKSKYKVIEPGDIGYNTMRMWQGVSAVSSLRGIVSPAYTICIPRPDVDVEYMGALFKFPPMVNKFWRFSQGLVDDTLNLKFPNFAVIPVEVPGMEEQAAIARVLKAADVEIKLLERKLSEFERQRKALMQKLLTGEVRVKV